MPAVAVVGAGISGLCAALDLRVAGCEVTVLERAATPGGKLRRQHPQGLALDTLAVDAGPTVLTAAGVFADLFRDARSDLAEHLRLEPLATLARHAWSATERLDLHADIERSAAAIADFAGAAEARGYLRFCADSRRIYATLDPGFMRAARPSLAGLIRTAGPRRLPDLLRLRPFTTLWRALGGYFRDPRLRQLFGRYATYCGSSPFAAPATLMLVAHLEQAGVWQVAGGIYALAEALAGLLRARGVTLRYATEVRGVRLRAGRVQALELAGGERLAVSAAILSCDAAALASGLFGPAVAPAARRVRPGARSLSALTWTACLPTAGFDLLRHNVFFSADYAAEFAALRAQHMPAQRPTVYVCAQDRQSGAPPLPAQPERLLCLINAPANGDVHDYAVKEIEQCLTLTRATLEHCGLRLAGPPDRMQPTTPADFHRLFPGSGGALYGAATHGWRSSFQRPGPRTPVPGLYLAGGSTHPGPGLPMAATSGRNAARCLLQDRGLTPH
jgi:1-hydroxycarotenoid 3,4-desaturase